MYNTNTINKKEQPLKICHTSRNNIQKTKHESDNLLKFLDLSDQRCKIQRESHHFHTKASNIAVLGSVTLCERSLV